MAVVNHTNHNKHFTPSESCRKSDSESTMFGTISSPPHKYIPVRMQALLKPCHQEHLSPGQMCHGHYETNIGSFPQPSLSACTERNIVDRTFPRISALFLCVFTVVYKITVHSALILCASQHKNILLYHHIHDATVNNL